MPDFQINMRGGKRPGAGRKKGSKSKATLEKEAVLKAFRERVMRNADILFDSQLTLARGQTFLYKIEKELQIGPKGGKRYVSSKPKLVTNQWEIEAYLENTLIEGDPEDENDPNATYYYLTTKEPDNRAIDSMLDRTFGRATQPIGGDKDNPLIVKGIEVRVRKQ
jgi:hypothetical protein